jgi:DNA-binding SARP family transcriptional activator
MSGIMLRLFTFGGLWLETAGSERAIAQPRRLALLALVAAAGRKGISRDRVLTLLWPDTDAERARHSLSQILYSLRKDLGADPITEATDLRLDPAVLSADITELLAAAHAGDIVTVARLYTGPFLDGFHLTSAPEFEAWVEEERAVLRDRAVKAIEALATRAAAEGDWVGAAEHWRHLTRLDPLNARLTERLMRALASSGNRAGALSHFRQHEAIVRAELDTAPEAGLARLADELRRGLHEPVGQSETVTPRRPEPSPAMPEPASAPLAPDRRNAERRSSRFLLGVGILATVFLAAAGLTAWLGRETAVATDVGPVFAVGIIRDRADTTADASVLSDMVATSLATVPGLRVVGTSRLYELMPRDAINDAQAVAEAARRAGASDLLEGDLTLDRGGGFALTLRRVNLRTGLVGGGFRARGLDRFEAVDSAAWALAKSLGAVGAPSAVSDVTTSSPAAYGLYQEGLRAFYQWDVAAAHRLMEAALAEDSTFAQAAYYTWLSETYLGEWGIDRARQARRLAVRLPDRGRLLVLAHTGLTLNDPSALAHAESLGVRYPNDPEALYVAGVVRDAATDAAGAKRLLRRAMELDLASGGGRGTVCRLCLGFRGLTAVLRSEDSLDTAEVVTRRWMELLPGDPGARAALSYIFLAQGRYTETLREWLVLDSLGSPPPDLRTAGIRLRIHAGRLAEADVAVQAALADLAADTRSEARWLGVISLRHQGRYRDAGALLRQGPEPFHQAILAFETGRYGAAAEAFRKLADDFREYPEPHIGARNVAWRLTLAGMAHASAGDTAVVRRLADSVEAIGRESLYGRDARLHWFLRGLLLAGNGEHVPAVEAFERAISSPSEGFTRINWELARSLMVLDRASEAIPLLRSALHGGVDGPNLYITRTELHELLAQAFDQAGQRDSARAHYAVVAAAWAAADPVLAPRVARARQRQ